MRREPARGQLRGVRARWLILDRDFTGLHSASTKFDGLVKPALTLASTGCPLPSLSARTPHCRDLRMFALFAAVHGDRAGRADLADACGPARAPFTGRDTLAMA